MHKAWVLTSRFSSQSFSVNISFDRERLTVVERSTNQHFSRGKCKSCEQSIRVRSPLCGDTARISNFVCYVPRPPGPTAQAPSTLNPGGHFDGSPLMTSRAEGLLSMLLSIVIVLTGIGVDKIVIAVR